MPRFARDPFAEQRAKELRRNLTEAEALLWYHLRGNFPAKFRRQEPSGRYICDLVSYVHRLVVELDGSHQVESRHDVDRDAWLDTQGFRVMRSWNEDVMKHCTDVLDAIYNATVRFDA